MMISNRSWLRRSLALGASVTCLALAACDGGPPPDGELPDDRRFATLAGLLRSAGPLGPAGARTVFAPSNAAFGTFLGGLNDGAACVDFLKGEGKPVLTQILLYHVVGDRLDAAAIAADPDHRLPTLLVEGAHPPTPADLLVSFAHGDLLLNRGPGVLGGAGVVQANVPASNGVAHVIDDVLLSPGLRATLLGLPPSAPCRPTH